MDRRIQKLYLSVAGFVIVVIILKFSHFPFFAQIYVCLSVG